MRWKARNPNPSHVARHTLIVACTGSGKSTLLLSGEVMKIDRSLRVVGYDDVGTLPGLYYSSRAGFLRALKSGLSKQGFRIFYGGTKTPSDYMWFCEVVWSILDGDKETVVLTEELASVSSSSGKAEGPQLVLLNEGRKYGAVCVNTCQKTTEISKTVVSQSRVWFCGQQAVTDAAKSAAVVNVRESDIKALRIGEFYRYAGGPDPGVLVRPKLREKSGVKWMD